MQPYAPFLTDIYNTTGILWQNYIVPSPFYSYFFDSQTPYVNPGTNSWNIDTYGKGMKHVPYSKKIVKDILDSRDDFQAWYNTSGGPTDPVVGAQEGSHRVGDLARVRRRPRCRRGRDLGDRPAEPT